MTKYDSKTKDGKCIFCQMASGNINPDGLFWEDEKYMAFIALTPNTEGFSVVIPKRHFSSDVLKMPDKDLNDFVLTAKKVANILENYFDDVGRVGLIMEGTGVDHAHIKLFPMHGTEHMKRGEWKQILSNNEYYFENYEGYISSHGGPIASPEALKELASKIRSSYLK